MPRNVEIYTVNGFTGNLNQIAKHFDIKRQTLSYRLNKGFTIEEAINTTVRKSEKFKIYTINGFTGTLIQIAEHFNIKYATLFYRMNNLGWSIEKAVNTPIKERKQKEREIKTYTVNNFTGNLTQIAKYFGINAETLRNRINKQGMPIKEAVNTPTEEIHTVNGFTGNLKEIAEHFNINYRTLYGRLRKGFTIEEAVLFQKEYYGQKKE